MNCPLCGTKSPVLTTTLRRGTGTVYHCPECDLGFLDGQPTNYNGPYRQSATPEMTTPEQIYNTYAPHQRHRLDLIMPHVKDSILEFGASAGQFLTHIDVPRRCAVEPDEACMAYMLGMGIDRPMMLEQFNTVCAFQVMEHVADPVEFLATAMRYTKPGGTAFIEVPNLHDPLLSVWNVPEYRQFYYHSDHLFYFSARALRRVAAMAGHPHVEIIPMQDYNLLNHLHWLTTGTPQPDCHIGLSPIHLDGYGETGGWLVRQLRDVNDAYCRRLAEDGLTSNLMMVISKSQLSIAVSQPASNTDPQA